MTEFKVGDKVKIVKNTSRSNNAVGEIGVITYVDASTCFVEVVEGRSGCYHVFNDLELITESKFYEEVVTKKVILNCNYVTTNLPSGSEFVTLGSNKRMTIMNSCDFRNDDIPTIISHLQQWYDAVQLKKSNEPL